MQCRFTLEISMVYIIDTTMTTDQLGHWLGTGQNGELKGRVATRTLSNAEQLALVVDLKELYETIYST